MINKPSNSKLAERERLAKAVEDFKRNGGEAEQLPGFGQQPTMDSFDPKKQARRIFGVKHQ